MMQILEVKGLDIQEDEIGVVVFNHSDLSGGVLKVTPEEIVGLLKIGVVLGAEESSGFLMWDGENYSAFTPPTIDDILIALAAQELQKGSDDSPEGETAPNLTED
jgi:hypothetical protein